MENNLDEVVSEAEKVLVNSTKHLCPITLQLFKDPVFVEGWNFEREAIERWFQEHETNPQTNRIVPVQFRVDLKTNFSKKSDVEDYRIKVFKKCLKYYDLLPKYPELQKKLIYRAQEMDPNNVLVLEKLGAYEEKEKKKTIVKKLVKALIDKGELEKAKSIIFECEDYQHDEVLLGYLVEIEKENVIQCDKHRLALARVLYDREKKKESLQVVKSMVKESQESLELEITLCKDLNIEVNEKSVEHLTVYLFRKTNYDECVRVIFLLRDDSKKREHLVKLKYNLLKLNEKEKAANVLLKVVSITGGLEAKIKVLEEAKLLHKSVEVLDQLCQTTQHLSNKFKKNVEEKIKRISQLNQRVGSLSKENRSLSKDNLEFKNKLQIEKRKVYDMERLREKESSQKKRKAILFRKKKKQSTTNLSPSMNIVLSPAKSTKKEEKKGKSSCVVHQGFICDGCHCSPIIGIRYSAIDPQTKDPIDFDICEECHGKKKWKTKIFEEHCESC